MWSSGPFPYWGVMVGEALVISMWLRCGGVFVNRAEGGRRHINITGRGTGRRQVMPGVVAGLACLRLNSVIRAMARRRFGCYVIEGSRVESALRLRHCCWRVCCP